MHSAVQEWVQSSFAEWRVSRPGQRFRVLEFGSLDINGSVRPIFSPFASDYVGVDMQEGPGVDIVADASTFDSLDLFDIVVCCEVYEHTPVWREITANSHRLLTPGGLLVGTCAGEGRPPHSAIDENPIRDWEYYANVTVDEMQKELWDRFQSYVVSPMGLDLRWWAVK